MLNMHVQCAMLVGNPFCPAGSNYGCISATEPTDFRLKAGEEPVGMFCMHDRLHRNVLIVTKIVEDSGTCWRALCAPVSEFASIGYLAVIDSQSLANKLAPDIKFSSNQTSGSRMHAGKTPAPGKSLPGLNANNPGKRGPYSSMHEELDGFSQWEFAAGSSAVFTSLSPDGTMLAVAGSVNEGCYKGLVILDVRGVQQPGTGSKGVIHVRSRFLHACM